MPDASEESKPPGAPRRVEISKRDLWFAGVILALVVVMGAANLLAGYLQYQHFKQQYQLVQQTQKKQSALFLAKLCATLDPLAALVPPPGPSSDLARQYLIRQHNVLAQLGPDVGCR